jgi:glycerol-3-phosphate O-acyltransferase/dihydroxyacetone phosphate acyltransferase
LIASNVDIPVRFIIAAKSTKKPIIGQFSRILGGIPVERAQDIAKQGTGNITHISTERIRVY